DRRGRSRPVAHRPVRVPPGPAAAIQECLALPVARRIEMNGPEAELLLLLRREVAESLPGIAESIGRSPTVLTLGLRNRHRVLDSDGWVCLPLETALTRRSLQMAL